MVDVYWADWKKPTQKQRNTFKRLVIRCRENGLSDKTNRKLTTREDYGIAIDILMTRLRNAGVIVKEE